MDQKLVQREFADHIKCFNNPTTQSAINALISQGFDYGTILATILANIQAVLDAFKSPNPWLAIVTLLLNLLGSPAAAPVPSAKIESHPAPQAKIESHPHAAAPQTHAHAAPHAKGK